MKKHWLLFLVAVFIAFAVLACVKDEGYEGEVLIGIMRPTTDFKVVEGYGNWKFYRIDNSLNLVASGPIDTFLKSGTPRAIWSIDDQFAGIGVDGWKWDGEQTIEVAGPEGESYWLTLYNNDEGKPISMVVEGPDSNLKSKALLDTEQTSEKIIKNILAKGKDINHNGESFRYMITDIVLDIRTRQLTFNAYALQRKIDN